MWVRLKNIQVYAYHGAHAHEREHGGRFELDVEFQPLNPTAFKNDDLAEVIDYVKVQECVVQTCTTKRYHLIESLCDAIASQLIASFPMEEVIIRVRKPGASAGVVLDTIEVECRKTK